MHTTIQEVSVISKQLAFWDWCNNVTHVQGAVECDLRKWLDPAIVRDGRYVLTHDVGVLRARRFHVVAVNDMTKKAWIVPTNIMMPMPTVPFVNGDIAYKLAEKFNEIREQCSGQ